MAPVLTFAEAYLLRKRQEKLQYLNRAKYEDKSGVSNLDELDKFLRRMKRDIQSGRPERQIKHRLQTIPARFSQHVCNWKDEDHLDLVHLSILNNKPELVAFLLGESNMFQVDHEPVFNPYAHLAAIAGQAECLRSILVNRPTSFFACKLSSHAIRLPAHIQKTLKVTVYSKQLQKSKIPSLTRIQSSAAAAENKMMNSAEPGDIEDLGKDLDKSFQKPRKTKHFLPLHIKQPRRGSRAKSVSGASTKDRQLTAPGLLPTSTSTDSSKGATGTSFRLSAPHSPFRPKKTSALGLSAREKAKVQRKAMSRKHIITIYIDDFFNEEGVVRGAGQPIDVRYRQKPRDNAETPRKTPMIKSWSFLKRQQEPSTTDAEIKVGRQNAQLNKPGSTSRLNKRVDIGIRAVKKIKDFQPHRPLGPVQEKPNDAHRFMYKTPLTLAAERGYKDCVQVIFDTIVLRSFPMMNSSEQLTLATRARSPETILLLLDKQFSRQDYQGAVLLAIRDMYPVCLTALLNKGKNRNWLFDGTNLYHVLFSQCVISNRRYELMPEMTRALVACKENVNDHTTPRTFPMYTLINCAFSITDGQHIFYFIECLLILLENKANPHFNETKAEKGVMKSLARGLAFARSSYTSAINCIFESAKGSLRYFEKSYWSKVFMKKFITTIEANDRTPRRILHTALFDYMAAVCELGLDRTIVRCLLRYGADPDKVIDGNYVVNEYFIKVFGFMNKFEIIDSYDRYNQELETLMIVCRAMHPKCLENALTAFLQDHLLTAPVQGLRITRQFAALVDTLRRSPRSLAEIAARSIWVRCNRDKLQVRSIVKSEDIAHLIIP